MTKTYEITSPDGKTWEVTAPDDASQDQVLSYAKSNWQGAAKEPDATAATVAKGLARGALDVGGMVLNTPQAVYNLAKAGYGTAGRAMGMPTEWMPNVQVPSEMGGANMRNRVVEQLGLQPNIQEGDPYGQMASTGSEILGGALAGGGPTKTISQLITNLVAPVAGGVAGEQIGGETGKIVGSIAAPLSVMGAAGATRALARGVGSNAELARRNAQIFEEAGVNPTLADVAPSRAVIQNSVARIPGASNINNAAIAEQEERIRKGVEAAVPNITATPIGAGKAVQEGLEKWKNDFQATYRTLRTRADNLLPGNTPITTTEYEKALTQLTTPAAGAPAQTGSNISQWIKDRAAAYQTDIQSGQLTVDGMRKVRSQIGEQLEASRGKLIADQDAGAKKLLYKALSQDMEAAAAQQGPDALRAMKVANAYYSTGMDRIDNFFQKIVDKADPEHVFNSLVAGGKKGSEELRTVMKSLDPSERDLVASAAVLNLGKAKGYQQNAQGNEFSFQSMLTNWANLTPESKRVLFAGTTNPTMPSQLDKLAEAASKMRESGKVLSNPSGTAAAGVGAGVVTAFVHAPISTMVTTGSTAAAAYLMTSPRFINWAVQSTKLSPREQVSHLSRLAAMAQNARDTEFKSAVGEFLKATDKGTE